MKRLLGVLVLSVAMLVNGVSFAVEQTAVPAESGKEQPKAKPKKKSYNSQRTSSKKPSKKKSTKATDSGAVKTGL